MTYARAQTHAEIVFTAGDTAPEAVEAFRGAVVPNHLGNMALSGFRTNESGDVSEIHYDATVEPPVLRLTNALTTVHFGHTDEAGQFVRDDNEMSSAVHQVDGVYSGPGSELTVK